MKRLLLASAILLLPAQAFASSCNVSEFPLLAEAGVQVAQAPPLVDQAPVTTSGTSAQSSAFSGDTKMARFWCDTQSAVAVGANPTATTNNMPLSAGVPEYFRVQPGQKAAFILRP
ncbi:hypothetical protein [Bradyrhizobium sp. Arg816]|uniref:hypothetical protein n=1 Tax=Bradyrhizobium sp. Arg816 TaxID=2998491 RepID=UPI00249F5FA5|nr:hypothetical protein [Bradyrhizobium sp. Arg816]MDI3563571.1 hypothetical protein [Bradyrhizobium sp. Arg816]